MTDGKQRNFKCKKNATTNHMSLVDAETWSIRLFSSKTMNSICNSGRTNQHLGVDSTIYSYLRCRTVIDRAVVSQIVRENASTIPPLFYASVCADVVQSLESLESPIQNTSQRSVSVLKVIGCTSPLYPVIWHHAQQVKYSD